MKINEELEIIKEVRAQDVKGYGSAYEQGWKAACDQIEKRFLAPWANRTPMEKYVDGPSIWNPDEDRR